MSYDAELVFKSKLLFGVLEFLQLSTASSIFSALTIFNLCIMEGLRVNQKSELKSNSNASFNNRFWGFVFVNLNISLVY